jgi:integrase
MPPPKRNAMEQLIRSPAVLRYALANERVRIAMDLALLTGQRRGDLLTLTRAKLTDEGIVFNQSKTGAGVLVEWTDELRKITDRAKALKPQVPGEYLLRKRNGRPYAARNIRRRAFRGEA